MDDDVPGSFTKPDHPEGKIRPTFKILILSLVRKSPAKNARNNEMIKGGKGKEKEQSSSYFDLGNRLLFSDESSVKSLVR